jgi:beta-glucosidase
MEGGHAIADVLFGHANPSGKLPVVFPKTESQLPVFDNRSLQVDYGPYHGYRLLDRKGQEPLYPFGFGLSYTTFSFGNLIIAEKELTPESVLHASVTLTNTGRLPGAEVVQFYVSYPGQAVERPLKELKGFARRSLAPGESTVVELELPVGKLAYYDEISAKWQVETGVYALYAGNSSAEKDLLQQKFKIK